MKYFYTDHLAAAWMQKHFGMKLLFDDGAEPADWYLGESIIYGYNEKLYIHPDSLHLLEPQPSDIKTIEHCVPHARSTGEFKEALAKTIGIAEPQVLVKIIQRNGIPFMWPESENG